MNKMSLIRRRNLLTDSVTKVNFPKRYNTDAQKTCIGLADNATKAYSEKMLELSIQFQGVDKPILGMP